MAKTTLLEKIYYSISEVSQMTGVEPYTLRFWEKEFDMLRPKKNRGGNRMYTLKDIELVNRIVHLRQKEGLTIDGARNKLTLRRSSEEHQSARQEARVKTLLGQIRKDVEELLRIFP